MTARPAWWPERRMGFRCRYVVTVDGEDYGFLNRSQASTFRARLDVFTEKVALFRDRGRRHR